jgi:DNA-directed RNA polymerase subunit beta'
MRRIATARDSIVIEARREEAEAAAALAAPIIKRDMSADDVFDNFVETPESRDD